MASAPCLPTRPWICAHDLFGRRLLAEDQPRHRDGDDEQRRDREDGVIGKGGGEARGLVLAPLPEGFLDQIPDLEEQAHGTFAFVLCNESKIG